MHDKAVYSNNENSEGEQMEYYCDDLTDVDHECVTLANPANTVHAMDARILNGTKTGRWSSKAPNISNEPKTVAVQNYAAQMHEALEMMELYPIIIEPEEDMFNLSYLARKAMMTVGMAIAAVTQAPPEQFITKNGRLLRYIESYPTPRTYNARQQWKNRGKTSKRKGTRK